MVTHVPLDGAVAVIASDDRIRQVEVFDQRFELAAIALRDLATEDGREFRGLADGAIGVKQTCAERIEGGAALEDQVVAIIRLGRKTADADSWRSVARSE